MRATQEGGEFQPNQYPVHVHVHVVEELKSQVGRMKAAMIVKEEPTLKPKPTP